MREAGHPRTSSGLLLLADITGYTAFLETVAEAHPEMTASGGPVPPAYVLMVTLLDLVTEGLTPTFTPIQTEGDAVFAIADAEAVTNQGDGVISTIRATYATFRARAEEHRRTQDHECQACPLISSLELKFVVHAGTFVIQQLPARAHVAGPSVNLAHRLLKNRVTEVTGLRGYVLLTDAARELLGLDASLGATHTETYADAGSVSGTVVALSGSAA